MNNQNTKVIPSNLVKRMIKGVVNAWQSYSRAVDRAYSRRPVHEDVMGTELCTNGSSNISAPTKSRPSKASAFDDYSSYY